MVGYTSSYPAALVVASAIGPGYDCWWQPIALRWSKYLKVENVVQPNIETIPATAQDWR